MDLLENSAVTDLSTWRSASRSPSRHISLCIWDTRHLTVTLTLSNTPDLRPSRTDISTLHKQFLQSRQKIRHSCDSTILQQCVKLLHALIHSHVQSWFILYWRAQFKNSDKPTGLIFVDTLYEVLILWQWWKPYNEITKTNSVKYKYFNMN